MATIDKMAQAYRDAKHKEAEAVRSEANSLRAKADAEKARADKIENSTGETVPGLF